jgi:murein DD-endopeptidase MepM/ murein hydrolase activator NlpD
MLTSSGELIAFRCWDPPIVAPVSDPYREPACRWCPGNRGIEFDVTPGQSVRAVATGRVTFAGSVAGSRYLVVEHGDGQRATYGMLAEIRYRQGDVVVKGSIVGSTGERFYFGLREGDRYIDPTPHLGRRVYRVRLVPVDGARGRIAPSTLVCRSLSQT